MSSNPATVARVICGKKGGAGIEATCLIRPDYRHLPRLARFPKFESRKIRGQQNNLSDAVFPAIRRSDIVEARKITRRKNRMDRVD